MIICSLTTGGGDRNQPKKNKWKIKGQRLNGTGVKEQAWMEISSYFELNENESKNLSKLVGSSRSNALKEIGSI